MSGKRLTGKKLMAMMLACATLIGQTGIPAGAQEPAALAGEGSAWQEPAEEVFALAGAQSLIEEDDTQIVADDGTALTSDETDEQEDQQAGSADLIFDDSAAGSEPGTVPDGLFPEEEALLTAETEAETEPAAGAGVELQTETEEQSETESVMQAETETPEQAVTEFVTESETESGEESETETETETETEEQIKEDTVVEQRAVTASGVEVIARYQKDSFERDVVLAAEDEAIPDSLRDYLVENYLDPYSAVSVDITFRDEAGDELQPVGGNSVNIQLIAPGLMESVRETAEAAGEDAFVNVIHTGDDGTSELLGEAAITSDSEAAIATFGEEAAGSEEMNLSGQEVIAFDAESFSTYTAAQNGNIFAFLKDELNRGEQRIEITLPSASSDEAAAGYLEVPSGYTPKQIPAGTEVVIDLNGHVLSNPGEVAAVWFSVAGGSLTIRSSAEEKGVLTGSAKSVVNVNGGSLTLENCTFAGNSSNEGAAVHIEGKSTLTATDCLFEKNTAENGGGAVFIYGSDVTTTIHRCVFSENQTEKDGGAIRADGTVTIDNGSVFQKNSAGSGGAIKLENGTLTIADSMIGADTPEAGNTALKEGGGIYSWDANSRILLDHAVIQNNIAGSAQSGDTGNGGGIFAGGILEVSEGDIFRNNKAYSLSWGQGGGAICTRDTAAVSVSGGTIEDNYARASGGGILTRGTFTMTGGSIKDNTAQVHEGGGLSIMGGYALISAGAFSGNRTGYAEDGTSPEDGYSDWGGGGIFVADQGDATLYIPTTVLVKNNTAGGFGGGVAGCATGRIMVFSHDNAGAAIYGNSAAGTRLSGSGSAKNHDHTYAGNNEVFMAEGYQDYFCALSSAVSNTMFNGGYENWSGSADGQPVSAKTGQADIMYASSALGLTAHPAGAPDTAAVTITGNASLTHGGGILCNGYLLLGTPDETDKVVVSKPLEIEAAKGLADAQGQMLELKEDQVFAFGIEEITDGIDETKRFRTAGTNDASGAIRFRDRIVYNENTCDEAHRKTDDDGNEFYEFVYLLKETTADSDQIESDRTQYRITVHVRKAVGSLPKLPAINKTNFVIGAVRVERRASETEQWEAMDAPLVEVTTTGTSSYDETHSALIRIRRGLMEGTQTEYEPTFVNKEKPKEPETGPKEPETEPKEPETEPKEPETEPKEPETEPKEPETELKQPETEPKEPQTEPKQPQTEPQQPGTPEVNGESRQGVAGVSREKTAGQSRERSAQEQEEAISSAASQSPVKTGDSTPVLPLTVSMLAAGIAALYLALRRRKNR